MMDKHQMRKNERFQFVYELTKRERKGALFVHPGWMYCAMYNIATHLLQHIKPTCEHSQIGLNVLRTPGELKRFYQTPCLPQFIPPLIKSWGMLTAC